jgi:uracil-DNA glycosylase family 4
MSTVKSQHPTQPFNGIAFVGDVPSMEEIERSPHTPFSGARNGKLFNAMLRLAGIDRAASFVGYVYNTQYPDPLERKRLWWELENLRPNIIVALGETAFSLLTGFSGLANYRGATLSATSTHLNPNAVPREWKVLGTYHPADLPRQWKMFPVVTRDFAKALIESDWPEVRYPKRRLLLEPNLSDLEAWKPKLLAAPLLSIDIETGWGMLRSIGFAPSEEESLVVPFIDLRETSKSYWETPGEELQAWRFVEEILRSPVPKLGQNYAGYDFLFLFKRYRLFTRNLAHDTRILHHALFPELPKGLGFMQGSYSEQGAWKGFGGREEKRDA